MAFRTARQAINTLVLIALVLFTLVVVLAVALFTVLYQQEPAEPAEEPNIIVDGELVQRYAAEYDVDTEYLQLIMPGYLVYRNGDDYIFQKQVLDIPAHTYNIKNLTWLENGRAAYSDEKHPETLTGIDVSEHQKDIDWNAVAADGIDFAMIRIAYRGYESGVLHTDAYAEANLTGAINAGIPVGAYVFSQAVTEEEAIEEAKLAIDILRKHDITYPVVFDMEVIHGESARIDPLTVEEGTAIAEAFCKTVKKAGYTPMIYGNMGWLAGCIDLEQLKYDIWFAQYYDHFTYPYAFTIWQYSDSGTVSGIEGPVDMNLGFIDYSDKKR